MGHPSQSRRDFLKSASALGLAGSVIGVDARAAPDAINKRKIPASGERVPIVGLGTARTMDVDPDSEAAMQPVRGVLQNTYAAGGRVIDSSPMYGAAESVIGELAQDLAIADELFMATKVWTRGADAGVDQMEESRARMGGGRLELIQVHNLVDVETQLITLRQWRDADRVKYIGVTHYTVPAHDELARIVARGEIDFVQFNYNIATRNAAERLLPMAADNGVATLINEPFESGALFSRVQGKPLPDWASEIGVESWAQYFLKYILGHPGVTCAIPATADPAHAKDNMRAAYGPLPDQKQRRRMLEYFQQL
jgi:diketogulonate reductase-like aldo/keto reductase